MATITIFDLDANATGTNAALLLSEGDPPKWLVPFASVAATGNFAGQTLKVSGLLAEDHIGFAGGVTVVGKTIRVGGLAIASLTGGVGGTDLTITFNANAFANQVQTLVRSITLRDTGHNPQASQTLTFNLAGTIRTDAVTIKRVNDAPELDLNGRAQGKSVSLAYTENEPLTLIAPSATLSDIDSSNFDNGSLRVSFEANGSSSDQLAVKTDSVVALSGSSVSVNGIVIGAVSGGTNGADLVVAFNAFATSALVTTLLRHIGYSNSSHNPSAASRLVRFRIVDGDGTSNGGQDTDIAFARIGVTRINDAPGIDLNGSASGTSNSIDYASGDFIKLIAPSGLVVDADTSNFEGGSLRVSLTKNRSSSDQLAIKADRTVAAIGSLVFIAGSLVGRIVSNGRNGADLVINLLRSATPAAITALLEHVGYSNASNSPSTLTREITFTIVDGDGNSFGGQDTGSATATVTFTPIVPPTVTTALAHDTGKLSDDRLTSSAALLGTGAANAIVHFAIDGTALGDTAIADDAGHWTFTPTGLADGIHTIVASETTAAGTGSSSITFTLDTASPTTPILALATDSGNSGSDKVTNVGTINVTGLENGAAWEYSSDGGGTWSAGSGSSFTLSGDGPKNVLARQTDAAGNTSGNGDLTFTVDTAVPTMPILALATDSGSSGSDKVTNIATVNVAGLENGAAWEYSTDGGSTWSAGSGSSFTLSGDGPKDVLARQTDAAGNTSGNGKLTFTLDTIADAPADLAVAIGDHSIDNTEKTAVGFTVSGLDSDATADVTFIDALNHAAAVHVTGNGASSANLTGLADGAIAVSVRATDTAGNFATGTGDALTLDTSGTGGGMPPTPSLALAIDSGRSASDRITNVGTVNVAGLESGATWEFSTDGGNIWTTGSGSSFALSGDGPKGVLVRQTNTAGQTSANGNLNFTLDTTPALSPTFGLAATDQFGDPANHQSTSNHVTLVGQTEAGVSLTLLQSGDATIANSGGGFQFANVALAPGLNALSVQATDVAGNTSTGSLTVEQVAQAGGANAVLAWNRIMLDAIRSDASTPPVASRGLAMESIAVSDVVAAINGTSGYYVTMHALAGASVEAAIAAAAHKILTYLYPAQTAALDAKFAASLAAIQDGAAETDGVTLGETIANQVITLRSSDGWNNFVLEEGSTAAGQWRPTAPMYAPAMLPNWATLTPFALNSPDQFLPAGPPDPGSQAYADAVNKTKSLGSATSITRTADQTQIARFWADGPGTYTPSGAWNQIAEEAAQQQGLSLSQAALLFAELNVAQADAGIAAWNTKYAYDTWRPDTAIQNADVIGNPNITADPNWKPLIIDPPFPEYISGHSTYSGAAAAILTDFFGSNYAFSTTSTSLLNVTRRFTSFEQAAQEAGESRIYGGIHFEFSNQDGLATGSQIGSWVLKAFDLSSDTIAPKILLDQVSGVVSNGNPIITGHVVDNLSGVSQLQLQQDGGNSTSVAVDANGAFTVPLGLALDGSADGEHSLIFIAKDAASNTGTPVTMSFTLDTKAPLITFAPTSIQNGGSLDSVSRVAGVANPTGSALAALSYSLDGGINVPVSFNAATGAFDAALNLSKLGTGNHTLAINATDAAGNTSAASFGVSLPQLVPLAITNTEPMTGAGDVGVTFRPKVTFSRTIDLSTLTSNSLFATDTTGAKIPATIVPFADATGAWLFFSNPLPGASAIELHIDGNAIKGLDGALLDADGDGAPGGVFAGSFTTVNTAVVPGTTITGRVFDPGADLQPMTFDDVRAGPDQILHTTDDVYLNPIAGVKVFILGHENEAVFTDASGNFTLTNAPTGDVKVAFDGRTATNAPAGFFFPEMVMDTSIKRGVVNTIMGSMGDTNKQIANANDPSVYLPRLSTTILRPVSNTQPTTITAPEDSTAGSSIPITPEQLSHLSLTVQPGSIVDANGNPVADPRIGISTVPSSLVSDMLPEGLLQHTFDITIQAPDGAAFTTPAQLTMPNVFGLAPGEKTFLLSFDHTTGRLVIDGTATVSSDGLSVVSDPGSGVTMPGWHGMTPPGDSVTPSAGPGGPPTPPPPPDDCSPAADAAKKAILYAVALAFDAFSGVSHLAGNSLRHFLDGAGSPKSYQNGTPESTDVLNSEAFQSRLAYLTARLGERIALTGDPNGGTIAGYSGTTGNINFYSNGSVLSQVAAGIGGTDLPSQVEITNIDYSPDGQFSADVRIVVKDTYSFWNDAGNSDYDAMAKALEDCGEAAPFVNSIEVKTTLSGTTKWPPGASILSASLLVAQSTTDVPIDEGSLGGDDSAAVPSVVTFFDKNEVVHSNDGSNLTFDLHGNSYSIDNDSTDKSLFFQILGPNGEEIRGETNSTGIFPSVFLASNTRFIIRYADISGRLAGSFTFATGNSAASLDLPAIALVPDNTPDTDADGLSDFAEAVIGTDSRRFSTSGDGVSDGEKISRGIGALSSLSLSTGIVSSLPLLGEAKAIWFAGSLRNPEEQIAYVATGSYGLAIVNANRFQSPKILSQVELSGTATDVSFDTSLALAAVATGTRLEIVNASNPDNPEVAMSIGISSSQVEIFEGIAYANNGTNLDAIDLTTGEILQALPLGAMVLTGMARDGTTLYTMDSNRVLRVVDLSSGAMVLQGSIALPGGGNGLFVADGVAYVGASDGFTGGYLTVDVSNSSAPQLIKDRDAVNIAGTALALNGSGLGVVVGNPGAAFGTNVIDVVNTSDPTKTGQFVTRYTLPQQPYDVAIGNGIAYVADGIGGLQVVNYRSFDTQGVAPAIQVTQLPTDVDPNTPGIQVVEGQTVSLKAKITDDVQVGNVQLLVNGQVAVNDVQYPWDLSARLPSIAANGSNQLTLTVRATDTGGNATSSAPIQIQLVPDTIAPVLIQENISDGMIVGRSFRAFTFLFSEALDPTTVSTSSFRLVGPGGAVVNPISIQTRSGDRAVQVTYDTLVLGFYRFEIDSSLVTDRAGNALGSSALAVNFAVQPFSIEWINASGGSWEVASNWSTGQLPSAQDDVLVPLPIGATVDLPSSDTSIARLVQSGGGRLSLSGGSLSVANSITVAGTFVLSGGTFSPNGSSTFGRLEQSDGLLTTNNTVTVSGHSTLSGGAQGGPGTTFANGGAEFTSTGFGLDGGRTLRLGGASAATGSYVLLGLNASNPQTGLSETGSGTLTIANGATFNDQTTDSGLYIYTNNFGTDDDGSTAAVNNQGTFIKSGSAATSTITAVFNNSGTVDVQSGTLDLSSGGTDVGATYKGVGTVQFSGGTRTLDAASSITGNVTFSSSGTTIINGTYTGSGTTTMSGGTATFAGTATTGVLVQTAGFISGDGTFTVSGASTFSGGTQSGSGTTFANGGAEFISTGFGLDGGRTLRLGGTSAATGNIVQMALNGYNPQTGLSEAGSGTLTVAGGATFNDQTTDSGLYIYTNNFGTDDDGSTAAVNNQGTFIKSGSAATSTITAVFNNSGTVDVQSGTLDLSSGGTDVGATYKGVGTVQFSGGTRTLDAASSITTANVVFSGGTTIVNGTYAASGSTTVSGGTATLAGTTTSLGTTLNILAGSLSFGNASQTVVNLVQSAGLLGGGGTLTVSGASTFSGGTQSGSGTTFANGGAEFISTGFGLDGGRTLRLGGTSAATGNIVQMALNGYNPQTGLSEAGSGTLTVAGGATFNDQTTDSGLYIYTNNFGTDDDGSTAAVNNQGTFIKSGSAATSTITAVFNNSGTVDVQSGTLDLSSGGTDVGATYKGVGTVQFSGGTRTLDAASSITGNVTFSSSGTTIINGTYTGSGTTTMSGGTATFAGAATTGVLVQTAGFISGDGTFTVSGASTFSGGTQSGSGATFANGGAEFISTGFGLDGGRTLRLGGTSAATGNIVQMALNGYNPQTGLSEAGSGTLTVADGATFNDQTTDSGLYIYTNNFGTDDDGSTAAVNNQGTFIKSGSAATSTITAVFNNSGTVDVQSGTLVFAGTLNNSATLHADGGNIMVNAELTGGGSAIIGDNSQIEVGLASNQRIAFAGVAGTLRLDTSSSFTGQISGLNADDFLDLADVSFGGTTTVGYSGNSAGGVLTVSNGSQEVNVALTGNYLTTEFAASSDGLGGTLIVNSDNALNRTAFLA
ncbi:Ig-like domain-containing protein (plasmid) [Rhizobium leguminosarum]